MPLNVGLRVVIGGCCSYVILPNINVGKRPKVVQLNRAIGSISPAPNGPFASHANVMRYRYGCAASFFKLETTALVSSGRPTPILR